MNPFEHIDLSHLNDSTKAMLNGVPFLAGVVKDVPTPYYTKLLQAVVTFCVIGIIGWSAAIVLQNKDNASKTLHRLELLSQKIDTSLTNIKTQVLSNTAKISVIQTATKERVYRPEWERKYVEQDKRLTEQEKRLLYLEVKIKNQ